MIFCLQVLARTSSIFAYILAKFGQFPRHNRDFFCAYIQVSMTFRSKVFSPNKKAMTDGRTSQLYRPETLGYSPEKGMTLKK